ncbi:LAME_0A00562g1_1 [Lachancea meyersii CBS 8951]|uniref:LAME_0A00562g1_1 n=1 Tax=Lachancea meyersii CBS 8951 TaxID=1266667 RepID=A0A1G4IL73_9SACH|nr:LAME_0A00562g1_1 [Lachancea meyersii CBS 8951]
MKDLTTSNHRVRHGAASIIALVVIVVTVLSMVFGILADREANRPNNSIIKQRNVAAMEWEHPEFPTFYKTCNGSHLETLKEAFDETMNVTAVARGRLMAYGSNDRIYKRWFGTGNLYTVIGVLEAIAEIPKEDVLFRCDDIDGLCAANPNYYAGHHRLNATQETVICDFFYETKLPVNKMCSNGSMTSVSPSKFMGIDMIHRLFHVPTMSLDEYIGEYTEEMDEVLEMASNNATFAVKNVDSYLYYLYEVYSNIVKPGGCLGK